MSTRYGITSTSIGPMVKLSGQDSQLENPAHESAPPRFSSTLPTTISARPVSGGAGTAADNPSAPAEAIATLRNGGAGPVMSSQWKYATMVEEKSGAPVDAAIAIGSPARTRPSGAEVIWAMDDTNEKGRAPSREPGRFVSGDVRRYGWTQVPGQKKRTS